MVCDPKVTMGPEFLNPWARSGKAKYNEFDPKAAAWLRELVRRGLIAPGDVDERDVRDIRPDELAGFTQVHLFAGIGIWSHAARGAGWPDARPLWTASFPCQPFSAAGKGAGFADERHLWPAGLHLIRECRPPVIVGEQVASKDGLAWLDLVQSDLEAEGYTFAAVDLCAAGFGAPHIRQRLYFCAHSASTGLEGETEPRIQGRIRGLADCGDAGQRAHADGRQSGDGDVQRSRELGLLAADRGTGAYSHAPGARHDGPLGEPEGDPRNEARMRVSGTDGEPECGADARHGDGAARSQGNEQESGASVGARPGSTGEAECGADASSNGHNASEDRRGAGAGNGGQGDTRPKRRSAAKPTGGSEAGSGNHALRLEGHFGDVREWRGPGWLGPLTARSVAEAGATRGFWADCDWWYGRDAKYRPAGPGVQPLAHGAPARVGRLRGYGNAVVAPVAQAFLETVMEILDVC